MTEFERVLMKRDHMTEEEAKRERRRAHLEMMEMIEDGADYDEVEDYLAYEFGLEPDYIDELIF